MRFTASGNVDVSETVGCVCLADHALVAKGIDPLCAPVPRIRELLPPGHPVWTVVAIGYRIHKSGEGVGSILLGLYHDDGEIQMVGGASASSHLRSPEHRLRWGFSLPNHRHLVGVHFE